MARKEPDPLGGALEGELIVPTEAQFAAFKRRPSLGTARGVRRELAAVYLEFRRNQIDAETAKTAGFILRTLLESIRMDEIERRIEALENKP
jgi:hypothetical protein